MEYEIKKIDIWTTARFTGLFYALIGIVPLIFGLVAFFGRSYSRGLDIEALFLIALPLIGFVVGFILGVVFALVYNVIASHAGGIKIDIDYHQEENN